MWLVGWGSCLIVFVSETVGGGQVRVRREWEPATGEDGFLLELKSDPGRLGRSPSRMT
jgi:hypothetical protein